MTIFELTKAIHLSCVALTFLSFSGRGLLMLLDSPALQKKLVKIAPHIIDSVLLASAISLCFQLNIYPFVDAWLTAKVFALIAYIVLGTVALKRGKTKRVRVIALILALTVFGYMLAVARTHAALPWTAL